MAKVLPLLGVATLALACTPTAESTTPRIEDPTRTEPTRLEPTPIEPCIAAPTPPSTKPVLIKQPAGNYKVAPPPIPTCDTLPSYQRRLTFDWPQAERDTLREALLANQGLVFVERRGCAIHVLPDCHAQPKYEYDSTKLRTLDMSLASAYELWANVPSRAETDLSPVRIDFYDGGDFIPELPYAYPEPRRIEIAELSPVGRCEMATHVIVEVVVGAARLELLDGGQTLVELGRPRGCVKTSSASTRAKHGCLEPYAVALVPLDPREPYVEPCVPKTSWAGAYCIDRGANVAWMDSSLFFDPYRRDHLPELLDLSDMPPEQLAAERLPCTEADRGLELTLDGPRGRITEVCGITDATQQQRAAEWIDLRLPVSREPTQRFSVEGCPP